jgi:structural maintenance of chromosome 2
MINGKTVQQSEIQNMFHSVQLNVNNPHFLIMQGRITKVLNMKPVEILSMIEEAAGTRMFQTKKEAAMKTIEKKQLKVDELTKCMDDEISPSLEGLREQQEHFVVYQSNSTELGRLQRFCIASEYQGYEKTVNQNVTGKKAIEEEKVAMEATQVEKQTEAENCETKIEEIQQRLKEEMKDQFATLKSNEEGLSKELVKVKTLLKNHTETVVSEKDTAATLGRQVEGAKEALGTKKVELEKTEKEVTAKEGEACEADKESAMMRDRHQNALAGVADGSSAEVLSLPEQVATWEKRAREAQSQLQQGSLRGDHAKTKLKELKNSAKSQASSHGQAVKDADKFRAAITTAESNLKGVSFNEKDEISLRSKASKLQVSTSTLKDEVDRITTQMEARLNFEFKDPERGFDRSKVKGLVARLVTVTNPRNATALEVAAGARLMQVVVDTEQTGKQLLQNGGLRTRVTIIPLNKINSRPTDPTKVTYAKELAASKGGCANLALELVGFDQEVRKAMEYTFGNVIICDNPEIGKEIAFDRQVRNRTVTLEGDVFDPQGTMTGGSKNQIGSLLSRIADLSIAKNSLQAQMEELTKTENLLQEIETQGSRAREIERDLDLKRHALKMCEEKLADSNYMQISNEVTALEAQLKSIEEVRLSIHLYP